MVSKVKNNFKPSLIPIWNKFSIKVVIFFITKLTKSLDLRKRKLFNTIFPFYGKRSILIFQQKGSLKVNYLLM